MGVSLIVDKLSLKRREHFLEVTGSNLYDSNLSADKSCSLFRIVYLGISQTAVGGDE